MFAVVVADGDPAHEDAELVRGADLVIAADGGGRWLQRAGVRPHLVVGDLDSLDQAAIASFQLEGARVERHSTDKEASDTELGIEAALAYGADSVVVLGGLGGSRVDHELANVLLIADPVFAGSVRIQRGDTRIRALRGPGSLTLEVGLGAIVTLLPIGADATGVSTSGLQYSLVDESLALGRSRGLSNVVTAEAGSVSLRTGTLLVIEIDNPKGGET